MMSEVKVIDNFLKPDEFEKILDVIAHKSFPWFISDMSDYADDNNTQLYHIFYNNNVPNSDYYYKLEPVYRPLNIFSLFKVRAIATMQSNGIDNHYHTDLEFQGSPTAATTAVYYINENDGGTQFEHDGKIIKSVANRMVIFNSNLKHRTVKHTNGVPFRYVLNINYVGVNNDN